MVIDVNNFDCREGIYSFSAEPLPPEWCSISDNEVSYFIWGRNIDLLPLYYLLSEEMLADFPDHMKITRCPRDFFKADTDPWKVRSREFRNNMIKALSMVIWKSLRVPVKGGAYRSIPGEREDYSDKFSLCMLSRWLAERSGILFDDMGYNISYLKDLKPDIVLDAPDDETARSNIGQSGQHIIDIFNLQPVIDVMWKYRDLGAYSGRNSIFERDFRRSWYHTRYGGYRSFDALEVVQDHNGEDAPYLNPVGDRNSLFENILILTMDLKRYADGLSPVKQKILKYRYEGYTHQEIADLLGYKTHSAVQKNFCKIREGFYSYEGLRYNDEPGYETE